MIGTLGEYKTAVRLEQSARQRFLSSFRDVLDTPKDHTVYQLV